MRAIQPEPSALSSDETRSSIPVVAAKVRLPPADSCGLVRLDAMMARLWGRRLGLVVAPAGCGKTTLLARFASASGVPAAWYRCESWDATQEHLLRHLERAFEGLLGEAAHGWRSVEDAATALEGWAGDRALLVVDDAHAIAGTEAEAALERLVDYAPAGLLCVVASRTTPGFNLSRLRVSGAVGEVSGDDLRFRSWEVESLFRDFYQQPLPPVELAELARRTGGWAAGLQLFHLATSGKPPAERQRILRALGGGSRIVREYLARNVLNELPASLRTFLIDSCVLGRLSGPICDLFLDRRDSGQLLQELERRQIFTTALGDDGDYRYHEVLRSHLEYVLVGEVGEASLRSRYRGAAAALEHFGAVPEALHAYCRAEDWTAVDRVLGRNGAQLAQGTGVWIDALPASVLEHDPWLLLASARRHRAEGRWQTAIETYLRAERAFGPSEAITTCQRERQALAAWLTPTPAPTVDPIGMLRLATRRDPGGVWAQLSGQTGASERLSAGLAALLAGKLAEARRLFALASEAPDVSGTVATCARLAAAVAALLAGDQDAVGEIEEAVEEADAIGQGFVARLGRACKALGPAPDGAREASAVRRASDHIGDQWGSAAAALLQGWSLILAGRCDDGAVAVLDGAAGAFHSLGAGVPEAWARALVALALAQSGEPAALGAALQAENLASSVSVEGAKLFVYLALAMADLSHRYQYVQLALAAQAGTGLKVKVMDEILRSPSAAREPKLSIRCFGEFRFLVDGSPLQNRNLKPRTRALLRRLSADAGRPVHREVLQEALWPEADGDSSARNLQVAISSLRHALEPGVARGASSLLVRDGETYRLVMPQGSEVDLNAHDEALKLARSACSAGDLPTAVDAFGVAAHLSESPLLPDDGSADWVVQRRERCSAAMVGAAQQLASVLLSKGDPATAATICLAGLRADRYDDSLWRFLIAAREQAGDKVAASRAEADYRRLLAELGVAPTGR